MDNRSNEEAEWDDEMLRLELEELDGLIDLSLTGFEQDEIDQLDKPQTPTGQEDDLPDVPLTKDVVSREGDIWTLGRHKVICGDSTDPRVYERLMGDELADAIWTDPPYNINYTTDNHDKIMNDNMSTCKFKQFLTDAFSCAASVTKPGAAAYVAFSDKEGIAFREAL